MGVNYSKPTNFEELMDNSSNNGLNTSKKNNPANQSIEAVDISEDSDEEDPNSEISIKSLSTSRKFFCDSQPILVPEDVDQSFFTDNHMYPDAESSQTSPARLKSSKKASECIRATCESRDSLDNDLELSAIESASIDDLADSSLFDILDEEFELRDPMEQQLLKRKVSPGRNSCEPLLKKQKVVDEEEKEVDADVDAEMGRIIQLEKKKMKALKERLKEENRLKWMESYEEAIYEEVGDEEDQYLPWVESEPPEPPRYLNILMQALEAQADARCGKRTVGPEEMAFEKQRKELGQDDLSLEGSDGRNDDDDDDNVRQKRKKGAKGQALERNGSGMWGSNARSFASNDEELQKLNDTWETGTFSSVESTDSENGARADFIKRLRANSMSFLDAPYFLPSDVQCEMEVDEEAEAESRSELRSDVDIFTDEEEGGENGKDADDGESLISEDISVGEDKEDEKGVGEDEEAEEEAADKDEEGGEADNRPKKGGTPVDKPKKGGAPVDKPKKGGAPVDKRRKGAAPVDKPEKRAAPIYEPEKGGLPVDEDEEFGKADNEPKKGRTPVVEPKKSGGPVKGPEKRGGPVNGPEKGGTPVAEEEEVEKAANGPEKAGKPVNEPKKCGAPAVEVVPSRVETDLPLNKQKSAESVIILESQEVIDVPSSSDDESQPDDAPVLPEDEVNVADFLETSMVEEEEEELNVLPPEVLVNPFFSKKRKQKRNTEVTTANTSISTFQLPDAFDMKYLEITITPMASNDPENPQMSDSIKIRAENSNRPKITKKKETKGLRTPMKVKISRDQKLMRKNKVNNGGKCATKGTKNVPPKEIEEIDLVDSDD